MTRWFNIAGPCKVEDHYMLPPVARLPELRQLVERKAYFVLHAPRQTGKSTVLFGLAAELTKEGRFAAVVLDVKPGSAFSQDTGAAEQAILGAWRSQVEWQLPAELRPPPWPESTSGSAIGTALRAWASACPRPLVTLLDEVDSLRDQALVSLLDQLCAGFPGRPRAFPSSIVLAGVRDLRAYRVSDDLPPPVLSFDITSASLTMRPFSRDDATELFQQYTRDTGQRFDRDAIDKVILLSAGQPLIVNALAGIAVGELVTDRTQSITPPDIDRAWNRLLQRDSGLCHSTQMSGVPR